MLNRLKKIDVHLVSAKYQEVLLCINAVATHLNRETDIPNPLRYSSVILSCHHNIIKKQSVDFLTGLLSDILHLDAIWVILKELLGLSVHKLPKRGTLCPGSADTTVTLTLLLARQQGGD